MRKKSLVLKFTDSGREFLFEDKVFVIEDKKLTENLEKPSIKNSESKLVMKSMNDTHISDVIQIKINLNETGHFLVSFAKDSLNEEKRGRLLKEIETLKSNAVQTNSTQLRKAIKLVGILNKYKPIYATFTNDGQFKVNITKLSLEEFKFPLLILTKKSKRFVVNPKSRQQKGSKSSKPEKTYSGFSLFAADYLFVFLFALLGSFGIITSVFEIQNKETIAIFLVILAAAFSFILILAVQSTCYKKGKLIHPALRFYLIIFILLGVAGGIVGGYYVSKLVFKTEIANFDYKKLIVLSSIISVPVMLSSLLTSLLVNRIVRKRYQ